ncbi:MAG: hypothetical protein M3R04_06795 [bacterium]|nr:hypothetical protein [bacterium]
MAETTLSWSFNPWRDRLGWRHPAVALLLLLAVATIAGYAFSAPQWWPGMLAWGLLALAALLGMTANLFLPVRYRLDERGVTVHFLGVPNFRPWEHYRNYYVHDTGVHLTTMPTPSALDPFRGHLLLFNRNREEVVAMVKAHIKRDKQVVSQ